MEQQRFSSQKIIFILLIILLAYVGISYAEQPNGSPTQIFNSENKSYYINLTFNLFTASLTLLGFIALFMVFRCQTIDGYVDTRKQVLRVLLEDKIQPNPDVTVEIQNIGKGKRDNIKEYDLKYIREILLLDEGIKLKTGELKNLAKDIYYFTSVICDDSVDIKYKGKDYFMEFYHHAVITLVKEIYRLRNDRSNVINRGLGAISAWGFLSLIYLSSVYIFTDITFYPDDDLVLALISSFVVSMTITIYVIYEITPKKISFIEKSKIYILKILHADNK